MAMMPRAVGLLKFSRDVFLTVPFRVAMMTETFAANSLTDKQSANLFPRQEIGEVDDGLSLSGRADIGNLIDLQPVEPAPIREDEHVAVRIRDEYIGYSVFVSRPHPNTAFAAAALVAIDGKRRALQIAAVG